MDLLRKIDTKVVRQDDGPVKRELYQTIDTLLQVDRDRATGRPVAFEMAWDDGVGRRLFVAWRRGGVLKVGETDTGDALGAQKASPVEKASRVDAAEIVAGAKRILDECGRRLPAEVLQVLWACLDSGGPGAQTTRTMPGVTRRKPRP